MLVFYNDTYISIYNLFSDHFTTLDYTAYNYVIQEPRIRINVEGRGFGPTGCTN